MFRLNMPTYEALFEELSAPPRASKPAGAFSDEQRAALACPARNHAVVLAGAGAGKTRVLVERAAQLLLNGADPKAMAVVTFTRQAAHELRDRLKTRLGAKRALPYCGTVHALAYGCAKRSSLAAKVVDDEALVALLDEMRHVLPEYSDAMSAREALTEICRYREQDRVEGPWFSAARHLDELLSSRGLMDFTHMLSWSAQHARPFLDYVLVDEAQDLTALQLRFLERVARPGCVFWFIGDDDQSIYAFRGGEAGVMSRLAQRCGQRYSLTRNYRSARLIVDYAYNVIAFNPQRTNVRWSSARDDDGSLEVRAFDTDSHELAAVRQWLDANPRRAALARTQALVEPLKRAGLAAFTVHESKGREWLEVWVLGCEAGMFPHPMSGRDEERRLFYVAMTRAGDSLIMSYACQRGKTLETRHPSPFLFETQALQAR